eukprot:gene14763-20814_t
MIADAKVPPVVPGNTGNLPLLLVEGLAVDPALAYLSCTPQRAVQHVMLGNFSGAIIQFPLCFMLLRKEMFSGKESSNISEKDVNNGSQSASGDSQTFQPPQSDFERKWKPLLKGMFTPPTISYMLGIVVSSIAPLREAFFSRGGALQLVGEVTSAVGDLTVPLLMIVLGANLAKGPGVGSTLRCSSIVLTCIGRLLLMPLLSIGMVAIPYAAGWLGLIEPMAVIVMMITHATPTALMVHSISSMFQNKEDDVANLMFWQYVMSLLTLPVVIMAILYIVSMIHGTQPHFPLVKA